MPLCVSWLERLTSIGMQCDASVGFFCISCSCESRHFLVVQQHNNYPLQLFELLTNPAAAAKTVSEDCPRRYDQLTKQFLRKYPTPEL